MILHLVLTICCSGGVWLWACPPLACHSPMGSLVSHRLRRSGLCMDLLFQFCSLQLLFRRLCLYICSMASFLCQWRLTFWCPLLVLEFLVQVFPAPLNMLSHINYDFGFFITYPYYISYSVSLFKTALIILSGNFRPASFCGDVFSCIK